LNRNQRAAALAVAVAALAAAPVALGVPADSASRGPSTPTDPYVLPVAGGVHITSLLTVEDAGSASNGYEMAGIPDGLGAFPAKHGTFTALMNHELPATSGKVRRHAQNGAFVARLEIDRETLEVVEGGDHANPGVQYWNYPAQAYGATPSPAGPNPRDPASEPFLAQTAQFGRFCSSTLSDPGGLYNPRTGRGYRGQLYLTGEESGEEGRLFGFTEQGDARQLPRLGLFSWENSTPANTGTDRTVVMGTEDNADGQLRVYAGAKRRSGDAFDRAGLTDGASFVIDAVDQAIRHESDARKLGKGKPVPVTINEVDWDQSGRAQNRESTQDGLTFNRLEDGHFDPQHPDDYYFLTTEGGKPRAQPGDGGGLWRLRFEDVSQPELGAELTLVLDGSEAPYLVKPDNMTIDTRGNLLMQEDPGRDPHLARIVAYDIETGELGVVAQFDPARFVSTAPGFITIDEESSGIIDMRRQLGNGWFLFDAQVHFPATSPEYVEKGQLLTMKVRDWDAVYGR
jgi:hypothetical protein